MAKVYEVAFKINGMLSGQFAEAMRQAQSAMKGLSAAETADLVHKYVSALNGETEPDEPPDITRGHYFRGV